jgi:hypothetical protein
VSFPKKWRETEGFIYNTHVYDDVTASQYENTERTLTFFLRSKAQEQDRPIKINVSQNILHQKGIILTTRNNDGIVNLAETVLLQN